MCLFAFQYLSRSPNSITYFASEPCYWCDDIYNNGYGYNYVNGPVRESDGSGGGPVFGGQAPPQAFSTTRALATGTSPSATSAPSKDSAASNGSGQASTTSAPVTRGAPVWTPLSAVGRVVNGVVKFTISRMPDNLGARVGV